MKLHERAPVEKLVKEIFASTPRPEGMSEVAWIEKIHSDALAQVRSEYETDFAEFRAQKAASAGKVMKAGGK